MLYAVATCLLTFMILLAMPLTVQFELSWRNTLQGHVKLVWLLGLVRIRFSPSTNQPTSTGEEKWAQRFERAQPSSDRKTNLFSGIRQKAFRRRILRYLQDCWRAIHKKDLTLHARVGLGDPADTGMLWAILGPIGVMLDHVPQASVHIEPEFIEATLELDSSGNIRFIPLQFVYLTIGLFLSPSIWRGVRLMRGAV
jgi:hypothetical protein